VVYTVLSDRCKDWLKFYLDLERPEVNERSVWNYELCGSLSMIARRHYSSFNNLVLELHSDSVQTNNTGFRGIFKFIPRCPLTALLTSTINENFCIKCSAFTLKLLILKA